MLRERSFEPYDGPLIGDRARFFVVPRYAWRDMFASKIALIAFVACFAVPIAGALMVYLHHNTVALSALNLDVRDIVEIDTTFFVNMLAVQTLFGFVLAVIVGPPLLSRDLQNNALPLYLSRPLSRPLYVLGKLAVLAIPLSLITWGLGLLLFLFQAALEPGWLAANLRIGGAILVGGLSWALMMSLFTLAVSALVQRRPVAQVVMVATVFVARGVAEAINGVMRTTWGLLLSPTELFEAVWVGLFGPEATTGLLGRSPEIPVVAAWLTILVVALALVAILARRLRPWEWER